MITAPRFCAQCSAAVESRLIDGRQREVCPACGTVFYRNPLPVASALVLNDRRELLLVKRCHDPEQGMWCLPIGFAEQNETIAEAALREMHEEAGIEGRVLRLLDVDSYTSDFYGDLLIVTFEVEKTGGAEHPGDDADEVGYFPLDALPPLAFTANERAVAACRRLHEEEWAIRDSFKQLQAAGELPRLSETRLLSDALVLLIRERSAEIAAAWLADVRSNPTTTAYRNLAGEGLLERAAVALRQFGRWMTGAEVTQEARDFYRTLGKERRRQGVPAQEVLSSLMLLKKNVWSFARDHGMWERAIDVYRVLELNRRLVLFFDRAMYHMLRGYEGD
ncbi:MAG: NUDIX domain-containing protein [Candidatus Eisenbacteria bacterium]